LAALATVLGSIDIWVEDILFGRGNVPADLEILALSFGVEP
jgi:hypothetical protein